MARLTNCSRVHLPAVPSPKPLLPPPSKNPSSLPSPRQQSKSPSPKSLNSVPNSVLLNAPNNAPISVNVRAIGRPKVSLRVKELSMPISRVRSVATSEEIIVNVRRPVSSRVRIRVVMPDRAVTLDKMIADKMIVGKMIAVKMTADKMIAGKMIAGKMIAVKMIAVKMIVDKMIVDKMIADKMIAVKMIAVKMIVGRMTVGRHRTLIAIAEILPTVRIVAGVRVIDSTTVSMIVIRRVSVPREPSAPNATIAIRNATTIAIAGAPSTATSVRHAANLRAEPEAKTRGNRRKPMRLKQRRAIVLRAIAKNNAVNSPSFIK